MTNRKILFILLTIGLLYLSTLSPSIGFGDAGVLAAAATSLGVPHPPGFPTFVLLGHLFSQIPFGTYLLKLQLLGVMGGLGLMLVIGKLESWRTAILVAVLYGVWSQTGNVESYLLTNVCIFYLALSTNPSGILLGIASGLNPIGIAVLPSLIYRKKYMIFISAIITGVIIYSYLPFWASRHPFLNWGNPESIPALYNHLTGGGLSVNSLSFVNGFTLSPKWILDSIMRFGYLAFVQLNIVLVFAVGGAINLFRVNRQRFWVLTLILISNIFISGLYISGNRDIWLLTGLIVLVIFAGYSLKKWQWAIAFTALLLVNFPNKTDLSGQYLQDLYKDLPENSILIGGGEVFNSLSLYEYEVVRNKKVIPVDMTIYYGKKWYQENLRRNTGLKTDNYLPKFNDELEFTRVLEKFISNNPDKRFFVTGYLLVTPIYVNTNKAAYIPQEYQLAQHGLTYELLKIPKEGIELNSLPPKVSYLEKNYQRAADQIYMEYSMAFFNQGDFFKASEVAPMYFDKYKKTPR